MPKKHRLTRADFAKLPRHGVRRVHGTYFSLSIAPLPDRQHAGAACVVSKKVSPRAVVRNRIERQCREIVRARLARLGPVALVFHAKREAAGASFSQIKDDIQTLFERAGFGSTMRGT